ncbi:conserved hypothetical protein [Theileria equi strain WA]|uniref:RAP domain-containing protein n=1 Tax=Theileria equi strain WA TaxID=1537102 RepID=L1LB17_THEEQ|nr:conserved hypothetical protein [Theileria equi strain WA]EKX72642.1 conserved hypothetical protein [Theileria equi strain WA]|eukprot:XP_004832094.1 conserved hypothetical protein [Theileria equi strain WA]
MFHVSRIIPNFYTKCIYNVHMQISRKHTWKNATGSAKTLISLLDGTFKNAEGSANPNHEDIMNEAKKYMGQETTLYVDSSVFSKLSLYKPGSGLWNDCLKKINDKLVQHAAKKTETLEDKSIFDVHVLVSLSKSVMRTNLVSQPLASVLLYYLKNADRMIPKRIELLNSILEYLVYSDSSSNFPILCDAITECAGDIAPRHLASVFYYLSKLGNKNEAMIQSISRVLHNNIARGTLTSFEKTQLAKTYSILNHEHITFFNHISQELMHIFEHMDLGLYFNNSCLKDDTYIRGIGSNNLEPSGIICNVLKYIHGENSSDLDVIEFKGLDEQLYTCGQIVFILDSMIYLRIHHLENYFKRLIENAIKHCFKTEILESFDSEQLRCCISLLANCNKNVEDDILEFITRKIIQEYVAGRATNSQISLFLKDLVKQTRKVVKVKSVRNKTFHNSKFIAPRWINKPLYLKNDQGNESFNRSIIESLCTKICENVHSFKLDELTWCLRSVAYLGFRNDDFYKIFIPFFRERLSELNNLSIANITQAFNKAEIKEQYFFHLLGKQHQLYLNEIDRHNKPYIKRIG